MKKCILFIAACFIASSLGHQMKGGYKPPSKEERSGTLETTGKDPRKKN